MDSITVEQLTIADVTELVEDGNFLDALKNLVLLENNIHTLRARIYYHQGNYQETLDETELAGEAQGALLIQLNVYQYADGFRNPEKAKELLEKIGPTVSGLNSEVIAALKPDSDVNYGELMRRGEEVIEGLTRENATLIATHLMHNLARLAMDKLNDLPKAEKLINKAIKCYGEDTHLHHNAAANFWKTKILEKQGKIDEAIEAAQYSLDLWDRQVAINPEPIFVKKNENAVKRLDELIELHEAIRDKRKS